MLEEEHQDPGSNMIKRFQVLHLIQEILGFYAFRFSLFLYFVSNFLSVA
uniref:Uncharacterized protein LOC103445070 isoform X5 n=1 Tax=Rhizophora mucronata TaxID=61149 RepID=A0A2P2JVD3_RHIMU